MKSNGIPEMKTEGGSEDFWIASTIVFVVSTLLSVNYSKFRMKEEGRAGVVGEGTEQRARCARRGGEARKV